MSEKKKKKPQRLKARQPRGFVDRSPADIRATDAMIEKIRGVYELYGFDPIETPMFEYTDALGKFLPDTDRPNEGVFSLTDDDEQWMSLRYDLTAPLARHFAQNINTLQTPYRTYRAGWVFRNEKPGPGRFRQFMQFDADTVGAPGPAADAEMAMMMADTMEALGIDRGDYVVRVNSRRALNALIYLSSNAIDGSEAGLNILRAIDKADRLGWEGVFELLTSGRQDESGDFKPGVGVDPTDAAFLIRMLRSSQESDEAAFLATVEGMEWGAGAAAEELYEMSQDRRIQLIGGANELKLALRQIIEVLKICRASGFERDQIAFDATCVRGLEYYTGTVFECELTFPVTNEKGEEVVFGAVAGGGRYDGLVKRFTGQEIPATGFSIGVSRLMTALKNLGKLEGHEVAGPVLVTVMDRDTESLAAYQKMVQELRGAGIRAEMYQGNPKQFGKQLQYADRRGSPIAIIQGSSEREAGEVQIKDLLEGAKLAEEITDNEEWRGNSDEGGRPAQRSVPRDTLVAEVKKTLSAQKDG